tara:strand:+ start:86 stop:742 length:657 start_codon:yes stop_codon:yes gene_type:complete
MPERAAATTDADPRGASAPESAASTSTFTLDDVAFVPYAGEDVHMPVVMDLIGRELSEPYSVFTYRYFINNWPKLCVLAYANDVPIGVVVCKLEKHRDMYRGYVGMLVVARTHRKLKLGSALVSRALAVMQSEGADECVLEVESTNVGALRLYQNLGFIRDKRLERYYLSGNDAYRMKLLFPLSPERAAELEAQSAKLAEEEEEAAAERKRAAKKQGT